MNKCLICYKSIDNEKTLYHEKCLNQEFGFNKMPYIDIDEKKLKNYALDLLGENIALTGVQPKLSLWLEGSKNNIRFTLVDHKSNFIIKPQSQFYPFLPENEDLCMRIASEIGIETAKHSLIKLPSTNLAYVTKRFDRINEEKLACEDLCQLSEKQTEHKYRGSYEKAAKVIIKYSSQPGLDALNYFELVLFSYIIGNADMHLKNFSMLEESLGTFKLSPAYDLLATFLVIDSEDEQICLNLNGKKNRITKADFDTFANSIGLNEKQVKNSYLKYSKKEDAILWWVNNSFLPTEQIDKLKNLITNRIKLFRV